MNFIPDSHTSRVVRQAIAGLAHFADNGIVQELELLRLARAGCALTRAGCSTKAGFLRQLGYYLVGSHPKDGGWADVEETLWCLGYLDAFGETYHEEIANAQEWLSAVQLPCGAWGKSNRDQPRIPITALASALVPSIVDTAALEWLAKQWEADFARPTQLTYKGAFFLLSQAHEKAPAMDDLVDRTITYLCKEQNEDGGFGPWRDHPVGSDPWSTGVVLWGLSKFPQRVSKDVIDRAVKWLQTNQLPNGLWPYHYLDDGSSMALIGLSSVLPVLIES
jgi:hypothetical protein